MRSGRRHEGLLKATKPLVRLLATVRLELSPRESRPGSGAPRALPRPPGAWLSPVHPSKEPEGLEYPWVDSSISSAVAAHRKGRGCPDGPRLFVRRYSSFSTRSVFVRPPCSAWRRGAARRAEET